MDFGPPCLALNPVETLLVEPWDFGVSHLPSGLQIQIQPNPNHHQNEDSVFGHKVRVALVTEEGLWVGEQRARPGDR